MNRHRLLMLLVLVVFVGPRCASIPRRGNRTTVTGSVQAGRSHDVTRGCEGEFIDSEEHELIGGSVTVDHDSKSGLGVGVGMSVGQGTVVSAINREPSGTPERYMFGSAHGYFSLDRKVVGFDLGLNLMLAGSAVTVAPLATFKVGSIDHLWLELAMGPHNGYFDGEMVGVHIAGRTDQFTLRAGFGGYARPLLARDGNLVFGLDDIGMWPGMRVDGTFVVADGWSIVAGLVASETWSGWLGVERSFGSAEDSDTKGSNGL